MQAVDASVEAAETGAHAVEHAVYSKKLKSSQKADRLLSKSDTANVNALYQQRMAEHPEAFSNPLSRWQQKRKIRKEYMAARHAEAAAANHQLLQDPADLRGVPESRLQQKVSGSPSGRNHTPQSSQGRF